MQLISGLAAPHYPSHGMHASVTREGSHRRWCMHLFRSSIDQAYDRFFLEIFFWERVPTEKQGAHMAYYICATSTAPHSPHDS